MWSQRRRTSDMVPPIARVLPHPSAGPTPPPDRRPSTDSCVDAGRPSALWNDRVGRLGIRSGQFILIAAAVAVVAAALVTLRLVVVPLMIAVILAAAVWPLVGWLRDRGVPNVVAAWTALLIGASVLSALITLVVLGVRSE